MRKEVIGNATLYLVDCMEYMRMLPDNAFELAIVDPPYGIGKFTCDAHTDNNGNRIKNNKSYRDDYTWNASIPDADYFNEISRVSRKRIIWGANYYNCFENGNGALVWYKGPMTGTISHCEIASLSFQTRVSYVRIDWQSGFYREIKEGQQIHPCQKPVKLYEWLLANYAQKGDNILDTHLGSGSSAIACNNLGYKIVGCELDTDYFSAACERIENAQRQVRMFE